MDLIQPKHSYADENAQWHIYTNTSLRTVWAILEDSGVDISLHDENFRPTTQLDSDIVGINLLGAPYIPVAIETIRMLRSKFWNELSFVLGWQVLTQKKSKTWQVLWLDDAQFQKLFWDKVYNGMKPWVLKSLLPIKNISDWHDISLKHIYQELSGQDFLEYFTREISLYVSQWCKFDCDFCAAVKNKKEQYRDEEMMDDDLYYIVKRLQKLGKNKLSIYMSNLDVFQSPRQLEWFADLILDTKIFNPDFTFSLRGLAGTKSFLNQDKNHPPVLEKLVKAGFDNVWYGVDGMWPEVWKWIKKPQNNEKEILDAIRLSKEKYNITPELLMVFGHNWVDTEKSLKNAYEFVEAMVEKYWAVPRPHVAKSFIPGNDGRKNPEFQKEVDMLIENPHLFQSLDFTALASKLTHPDADFRDLVNHYYLKMCKLPGNTTLPIIPYEIWDNEPDIGWKKFINEGKFDR
jgi:hypothetical protein